jgi:hypothetical protein
MEMIMLIAGSGVLFVAAFAGWYALWHRRVEASFEKVPVHDRRSVHVVRHGDRPGDNIH